MKSHGIIFTLLTGTLLSAGAWALQAAERSDPPRTHNLTERASAQRHPTGQAENDRPSRAAEVNLTPRTPLREFPSDIFFLSDIFNERSLNELERAGIRTLGDLVTADPRRLSRILALDPRQIQSAQRRIRERL